MFNDGEMSDGKFFQHARPPLNGSPEPYSKSMNRLTISGTFSRSRQMINMVSSPAIVPMISGQSRLSMSAPTALALPGKRSEERRVGKEGESRWWDGRGEGCRGSRYDR